MTESVKIEVTPQEADLIGIALGNMLGGLINKLQNQVRPQLEAPQNAE